MSAFATTNVSGHDEQPGWFQDITLKFWDGEGEEPPPSQTPVGDGTYFAFPVTDDGDAGGHNWNTKSVTAKAAGTVRFLAFTGNDIDSGAVEVVMEADWSINEVEEFAATTFPEEGPGPDFTAGGAFVERVQLYDVTLTDGRFPTVIRSWVDPVPTFDEDVLTIRVPLVPVEIKWNGFSEDTPGFDLDPHGDQSGIPVLFATIFIALYGPTYTARGKGMYLTNEGTLIRSGWSFFADFLMFVDHSVTTAAGFGYPTRSYNTGRLTSSSDWLYAPFPDVPHDPPAPWFETPVPIETHFVGSNLSGTHTIRRQFKPTYPENELEVTSCAIGTYERWAKRSLL